MHIEGTLYSKVVSYKEKVAALKPPLKHHVMNIGYKLKKGDNYALSALAAISISHNFLE